MKLYPEAFTLFANESGTLRTPASRNSFRWVVAALQNEHPSKHLGQFTEHDLTTFCIGKGLAPKTIQHRRTVLRSVFEWLTWKGLVKENPAAGLKFTVSPGRHGVRMGTWLSEPEIAKVVRSCPDDLVGRRDRLVLLFGFMLGLRRAEIASLKWTDLSSDYRVLRLKGKGQKLAQLGVPAQLQAELRAWRQVAPANATAILPRFHEQGLDGRMTEPDWDHPLGPNGVYNVVSSAGARCELKLAPHDMRRSYLNVLDERGVQLTDIQRAARHSNPGTTGAYLDQNPRRSVAVTEGFSLEL